MPLEKLRALCARYRVAELALFGSACRAGFHADSAVDLLVKFHPENKTGLAADHAFGFISKSAALRIEPLTNTGVELTTGEDVTAGQHSKTAPGMFSIRLRKNTAAWRNAVALTWSAASAQPAQVQLKQQGDRWTFTTATHELTFDWSTGAARLVR